LTETIKESMQLKYQTNSIKDSNESKDTEMKT
jgi:hypothetical protein